MNPLADVYAALTYCQDHRAEEVTFIVIPIVIALLL